MSRKTDSHLLYTCVWCVFVRMCSWVCVYAHVDLYYLSSTLSSICCHLCIRDMFINFSRNECFLLSSCSQYLFEQRENEKRTEIGKEYRKTDRGKKENLPENIFSLICMYHSDIKKLAYWYHKFEFQLIL